MRPRQRAHSWYPTNGTHSGAKKNNCHGVVGCCDGVLLPSTGRPYFNLRPAKTQVVLARYRLCQFVGPSQDGQVCYVWSASKFNICRWCSRRLDRD